MSEDNNKQIEDIIEELRNVDLIDDEQEQQSGERDPQKSLLTILTNKISGLKTRVINRENYVINSTTTIKTLGKCVCCGKDSEGRVSEWTDCAEGACCDGGACWR